MRAHHFAKRVFVVCATAVIQSWRLTYRAAWRAWRRTRRFFVRTRFLSNVTDVLSAPFILLFLVGVAVVLNRRNPKVVASLLLIETPLILLSAPVELVLYALGRRHIRYRPSDVDRMNAQDKKDARARWDARSITETSAELDAEIRLAEMRALNGLGSSLG